MDLRFIIHLYIHLIIFSLSVFTSLTLPLSLFSLCLYTPNPLTLCLSLCIYAPNTPPPPLPFSLFYFLSLSVLTPLTFSPFSLSPRLCLPH